MVAAHYRSHVEFSFEALDEAAASFQRIEHFLTRARDVLGEVGIGTRCAEFEAAMDDDLGTPAAVAAVYDVVREGNKLLAAGPSDALRGAASSVRAMLAVLGVDPLDERWTAGGSSEREEKLSTAVDALVASLLEQQRAARAAKDFATADAIRDQLKGAGSTWRTPRRTEVDVSTDGGQLPRRGAVQAPRQGQPDRRVGWSRRRGSRAGPTPSAPQAKDRRGAAKAYKQEKARSRCRAARPHATPGRLEWIAGRNSVVEALRAEMPVTGCTSPRAAERDGRLREAFRIAADRGLSLLEVHRAELDRLTGGAVHQGLAARVPAYEYAHPDDLLDRAARRAGAAADRGPRLGVPTRATWAPSCARRPASARTAC